MKKDLLIAGILVVLAGLGIGVVVALPFLQKDDDTPKTIEPKPEPIAQLPKKEEPKKPANPAEKEADKSATNKKKPLQSTTPIEKKGDPETKKKDDPPPPPKKTDVKIDPNPEVKKEDKRPIAKIILLGDDLIKLNDPDGEYAVKTMQRGATITLIGTIKTLKIAGLNDHSFLDTSELVAEEIIFTGNMNSGSKVLLGKAKSLKVRDINDQSLLDGSALEAREIRLEGALNSGSTLKLHAVKGNVEFFGEVNGRSQVEIAAPESKVVFKSRGDSVINGDSKLTVLAKEVEFGGAINGTQTQVNITLTKDGSLKFRRLSGGVQMHYAKANAGDPEPRVDAGQVDARAVFRMLPAGKK